MRATTDELACVCALACAATLWAAVCVSGCSGGTSGDAAVPPPPRTPTDLQPDQDAPGVVVTILAVRGASAPSGFFNSGDRIQVDYSLTKHDGSAWGVDEMPVARILVSGPSFNYQRVIAEQSDVKERSSAHGSGVYTYGFAVPIPVHFLPPLNDSTTFGPLDGKLSGQALLDGTYTVGLTFAWDYTVGGQSFRDAGEATADFLLGDTAVLAPRELVKQENCDQCHVKLQAHAGLHRDVKLCLLCHTSGAEDANDPAVNGGSPGVLVDSRVLFHKLHNGSHLPSVVGVVIASDGTIDYGATPRRYTVVDSNGQVHDYSNVGFPAWPNRSIPMPKDQGYAALSPAAKAKDDRMRTGVTSCDACHGDPDGSGPLAAPTHGDVAYAQPSRRACASCHDYMHFVIPLHVNGLIMPAQPNDSGCNECHNFLGGPLAVVNLHRHPLLDTIAEPHGMFDIPFATGLDFDVQSLVEAGTNDGNGKLDPGEKVQVTFAIHDDAGMPIQASALASIHAVISGPTSNTNLVLDTDIPTARFTGAPPYTTTLPEREQLELAGHSTSAPGEVFTTSLSPHWNVAQALTVVRVRTGTSGVASSLGASATALQNFVDVVDASSFARDDCLVIDDGVAGREEYERVQFVDGNRLWFSSSSAPAYPPGLRFDHSAGAAVAVVLLQGEQAGVDYTLDATTGAITEVTEFGDGAAVLVDYTTDFVMPARYPLAANSSPDLDETWGKWSAKSLVGGTYRFGISGWFSKTLFGLGGSEPYTIASPPATLDFLVGSAQAIEPYALVSSGANCNACHQDLWFHQGQKRGFDNCILCHAAAGSEDRPQYVAANAPATTGVTVNFRTLLHSIARGAGLAHASTFAAVDASTQPYPDNFAVETFEHIVFPAMPGATMQCAKCHGSTNSAWKVPADRNHPSEQGQPVRAWRAVCAACHDSDTTAAHIEKQTPAGVEACAACHGPGTTLAVELVHKSR